MAGGLAARVAAPIRRLRTLLLCGVACVWATGAMADGGNGGALPDMPVGRGGTDTAIGAGGAGGTDIFSGGGGGGGGSTAGGAGGPGQDGSASGGAGGVHGYAGSGVPGAQSTGSNGSAGGSVSGYDSQGGGAGGWGAVVTGSGPLSPLTVNITGGTGGAGGHSTNLYGGSGGSGGIGLYFDSALAKSLRIDSVVQGGTGGQPGAGGASYWFGSVGPGGVGLVGRNLSIFLNGTIAGGLSGSGEQADAIRFTGGENLLILGSAAVLTGNIDVIGSLSLHSNSAYTLSNAIKGTGSLTKAGTGTLTLTGANTHAGGTTINAGTLQIGNGGTSGSVSGNIVNNAALAFNRSDDLTYAGNITGSGSLTKAGTGMLTLTGINTHTGGTTISAGTLQIGNGGTSGSVSGNIVNGAALAFNRSDNLTYAGKITGSGSLTKAGPGTLTLTGNSPLTGATFVQGGAVLR